MTISTYQIIRCMRKSSTSYNKKLLYGVGGDERERGKVVLLQYDGHDSSQHTSSSYNSSQQQQGLSTMNNILPQQCNSIVHYNSFRRDCNIATRIVLQYIAIVSTGQQYYCNTIANVLQQQYIAMICMIYMIYRS